MCCSVAVVCICCFFFFQAEDGIRDVAVTGVQTCALPISFFGGTYFPKAARFGLPGFAELCERIAAIWRDQPTDIASQNSEMRKALARTLPRRAAQRPEFLPDRLRAPLDQLRAGFDARFLGF